MDTTMNMIEMLRGSDVPFTLYWPNDDGTLKDLTNWTISGFEVDTRIGASLVLTKGAGLGEINGRIEWVDSYPSGTDMTFRIQISLAAEQRSTPLITVNVK